MFKKIFGFGRKDKEEQKIDEINEELAESIESINKELKEDIRDTRNSFNDLKNDASDFMDDIKEEAKVKIQQIKEDEGNACKIKEEFTKENSIPEKKLGFFAKIKQGLAKTKENFTDKFNDIFNLHKKIDDDLLDEIEEILVTSDMGVELTMDIIDYIKEEVKVNKIEDPTEIKSIIKRYLVNMLDSTNGIEDEPGKQKILMIVGVNGVGKTTSIGKLSYRLKENGKSVIVAAGDTFRAAAIEQLQEWGNRAGVDIIASEQGSDPGSIVYDAIQAARARKTDVLICDTAGRLHNKVNLMNELTKIFKIIEKEFSNAQREVLLVIDANTGQNGLIQAKLFKQSCNIDGIILTKLDSTAKGGIVFPIVRELNVPIKYVGVGEKIDDLQEFNSQGFVDAIFEG